MALESRRAVTEFVISLNGNHGTLLVDGEPALMFGALVGCEVQHALQLPEYLPRPLLMDVVAPSPASSPTVEVTLRLPLGPNEHVTLVRDSTVRGVHGPTGDYVAATREDAFRAQVKNWLEDADTWDMWPTIEAAILGVLDATRIDDVTDVNEQQRGYRAAADDVRHAIARALGVEAAGG
jgi:hypothetical protein